MVRRTVSPRALASRTTSVCATRSSIRAKTWKRPGCPEAISTGDACRARHFSAIRWAGAAWSRQSTSIARTSSASSTAYARPEPTASGIVRHPSPLLSRRIRSALPFLFVSACAKSIRSRSSRRLSSCPLVFGEFRRCRFSRPFPPPADFFSRAFPPSGREILTSFPPPRDLTDHRPRTGSCPGREEGGWRIGRSR